MKISAYCRVSTDSEQQEKSYDAQQTYFNREIVVKGNELYRVYGDEGETGTKLNNRKQFKQMLYDAGINIVESFRQDARRNKYGNIDMRIKKMHINYEESDRIPLFDEIWIKNTSRFARNTLSFQIIQILRNKGVHIYFIEQNINTKDLSADFLLKLFQVFDEQESRDKSSKVSFGQKERGKTKNTISTTNKIYGFKYIKDTNTLEIIEDEATVVRLIYQLYIDGYGIRRIINHLEEKKLYTRNNKLFCTSSIRKILNNEKYCGTNVRNKYSYGKVFNRLSYAHTNDKSEWVIEEDHDRIQPIIDKETFNEVQEKLVSNVHHLGQQGIYKGISEYAGLIFCGGCGAVYYSNVDKGRKYYNCSIKKQKGVKICNNPNVSETKIKEILSKEEVCSSLMWYMMQQRQMLKSLEVLLRNQYSLDNKDIVLELKLQLGELEIKKNKYVELYSDSIISKENLTQKVEPINIRIEELNYRIEITGKHNKDIDIDISEVLQAQTDLFEEQERINKEYMESTGIFADKDFTKEIDKIIVNEDGSLEIEYKIMTRLIKQFSKNNKLLCELKKSQKVA